MERQQQHPQDPRSNVAKFEGYSPDKYAIANVSFTVNTDDALTPGRPPCLTQRTIGKFLRPLTRELDEVQPTPSIDELPDAVINRMLQKDKAFWVSKPGANAYELTDVAYKYEMISGIMLPPHQDVFPRSYQYDLDCVKYRRIHGCDGLWQTSENKKPLKPHCRDCTKMDKPGLTPFQLAWAKDPGLKRWRDYPDVSATLTPQQLKNIMMNEVGRPFKNEACNWYYKTYPPVKYDCILRKFAK